MPGNMASGFIKRLCRICWKFEYREVQKAPKRFRDLPE
jgi:hypothetical protein